MNSSQVQGAERLPATRQLSGLTALLYRPRKLLLRRVLFQIHLWTGLALALYVIVIALSGSVLVFKAELTAAMIPRNLRSAQQTVASQSAIETVVKAFTSRYPGAELSELILPSEAIPAYQLSAVDEHGRHMALFAGPGTPPVFAKGAGWLDRVRDLHYYLLLDKRYGMQVNGIASGVLLVCALSGLVVWWPGVAHWRRAVKISLRSRWRRVNYDTHSAVGFWTLALVLWWAFSGVYFGWYRPVGAVIRAVSPSVGMTPPPIPAETYTNPSRQRVSLSTVLAAAQHASPTGRLDTLDNLTLEKPTLTAELDLRKRGDFSHSDIVTVDTVTGQTLGVWHYGENHTLGDWTLWAMHPLHFGTLWGMPAKIVWALAGLALAVLSGSGVVMYWNRYLRHRFR